MSSVTRMGQSVRQRLAGWMGPGLPQPDGQASAVQSAAQEAGKAMADDGSRAERPTQRRAAHPETVIAAALAQKLLHGWMQNRYQTRYPLTLNLRNQSPEQAGWLIQAVQYALAAVGADDADRERAKAWLATVGGDLPAGNAPPAECPVAQLQAAQLGPHAYAACAGALGRRGSPARRFLDFLAARLGIPDEVARSLNRRFTG